VRGFEARQTQCGRVRWGKEEEVEKTGKMEGNWIRKVFLLCLF
jgi:hypothetical protein